MRFRRKNSDPDEQVDAVEIADAAPAAIADDARSAGPYDVSELPEDEIERVDLGSLLIEPEPDREVRLQVDESTQQVQSLMIVGPDGAVDIRAFAAPRHGDLWGQARPQIAADAAQHGGTATERHGRFGVELLVQQPVQGPDGQAGMQPTRIVGINGPRWFLRATFLGRPAVEPEQTASWEDTLARIVVNRGGQAMPPGDPLPLTLPPSARRAT